MTTDEAMADQMTGELREPLSEDQMRLLRVIYEPAGGSGEWGGWPVWQYVDLSLDNRWGLDAASVLASLLVVGDQGPMSQSYGLTWRNDSYMQPRPDSVIVLTVAGLRHLPEAEPLLGAFLAAIRHLVTEQRRLVPSPREVVEATVERAAIAERVLTASIAGTSAPLTSASTRHRCSTRPRTRSLRCRRHAAYYPASRPTRKAPSPPRRSPLGGSARTRRPQRGSPVSCC